MFRTSILASMSFFSRLSAVTWALMVARCSVSTVLSSSELDLSRRTLTSISFFSRLSAVSWASMAARSSLSTVLPRSSLNFSRRWRMESRSLSSSCVAMSLRKKSKQTATNGKRLARGKPFHGRCEGGRATKEVQLRAALVSTSTRPLFLPRETSVKHCHQTKQTEHSKHNNKQPFSYQEHLSTCRFPTHPKVVCSSGSRRKVAFPTRCHQSGGLLMSISARVVFEHLVRGINFRDLHYKSYSIHNHFHHM